MDESDKTGGGTKRKIESRDVRKWERYGNLQEHKMFSNKENSSFINNNYRLCSYKFRFIEIKEEELR